jgi:hypothetical protein
MGLPYDVVAPSSPSLLFSADLLIFSAKLEEATKDGWSSGETSAEGGVGGSTKIADRD